MATVATFEDQQDQGRQEALARPTRIQREALETPTTDVAIFLAASTAIGQDANRYAQTELNATRLSTALGVSVEALEQWGAGNYGEPRQGAAAARVPAVFGRDPSPTAFTVPAQTVVGTDGGVTFRTIVDATFAPGSIGPLIVTAIASTAGTGGNVIRAAVRNVLGGPEGPLADTTVTVTNFEAAAGGSAEETPADYQARLQAFFQAARRATVDAIKAGAEEVPGVESASVVEVLDDEGRETGRVNIYIIGQNSQANSSLAALVRENLENYRAAGIGTIVIPSQPTFVSISIDGVTFSPNANSAELIGEAKRALVVAVGDLAPGEVLLVSLIIETINAIEDIFVPKAAIDTLIPADDVVAEDDGDVLRTEVDIILINGF